MKVDEIDVRGRITSDKGDTVAIAEFVKWFEQTNPGKMLVVSGYEVFDEEMEGEDLGEKLIRITYDKGV